MKLNCSRAIFVFIILFYYLLGFSQARAAPIAPCSLSPMDPFAANLPPITPGVSVDWGSGLIPAHGNIPPGTIRDDVPPASRVSFAWTSGGLPHCGFSSYNSGPNTTGNPISYYFPQPIPRKGEPPITDWRQTVQKIKIVNGLQIVITSEVVAGNIQRNSPWSFHPLSELPNISFRIADLAPVQATSDRTIYTAVNLDVYLNDNPNGFLDGNWSDGQLLDDLGIHIVNGQILGLNGIYWSTTEFAFDPDSATGWVPMGGGSNLLNSDVYQSQFGAIGILASHTAVVPEPSILSLVALCLFGMFWRKSTKARGHKSTGSGLNTVRLIKFSINEPL